MIRAGVCTDAALLTLQDQRAGALGLLRHILLTSFGLKPDDLLLVRNSFGRPSLAARPDIHVSLSHREGVVLAAAAPARIGVDVEPLRARDDFAGTRMLTAAERDRVATAADPDREFFRYWTLKESYVKALGVGLSYPVRCLEVSIRDDGTAGVDRSGARLRLEERFAGYVLAFCCLDGGPADADVAIERVELTRV